MIILPIYLSALVVSSDARQVESIRVVKVSDERVALLIAGRRFPIEKRFEKADSIMYLVERDDFTTIQRVFIWEVLEYRDLEDERGKYYSLQCHRLEIDPRRPNFSILEGASFSFWGHRSEARGLVRFDVSKISGMPGFSKPQALRFHLVQ